MCCPGERINWLVQVEKIRWEMKLVRSVICFFFPWAMTVYCVFSHRGSFGSNFLRPDNWLNWFNFNFYSNNTGIDLGSGVIY